MGSTEYRAIGVLGFLNTCIKIKKICKEIRKELIKQGINRLLGESSADEKSRAYEKSIAEKLLSAYEESSVDGESSVDEETSADKGEDNASK